MKVSADKKPLVHVFVCETCNYKKNDGSPCHPDTARLLRKRVKELCAEQVSKKDLRINASACLGNCEKGISAVIYPQAQHIDHLREGDEYELAQLALESFRRASMGQGQKIILP